MKELVQYINEHGGWKIVGWCRRGEIAAEGNEKVENDDVLVSIEGIEPFVAHS